MNQSKQSISTVFINHLSFYGAMHGGDFLNSVPHGNYLSFQLVICIGHHYHSMWGHLDGCSHIPNPYAGVLQQFQHVRNDSLTSPNSDSSFNCGVSTATSSSSRVAQLEFRQTGVSINCTQHKFDTITSAGVNMDVYLFTVPLITVWALGRIFWQLPTAVLHMALLSTVVAIAIELLCLLILVLPFSGLISTLSVLVGTVCCLMAFFFAHITNPCKRIQNNFSSLLRHT